MSVITSTREVLRDMLTENTGRSFLDSGDYYGRSWEENQGRDFAAELRARLIVEMLRHGAEPTFFFRVSLSTYHFLAGTLGYDPEMDERFRSWLADEGESDGQYGDMRAFVQALQDRGEAIDACPVNTYNYESLLDQVIQYVQWYDPHNRIEYALVQIHGGCDVRGGYTDARAFRVYDEETILGRDAGASIICQQPLVPPGQTAMFEVPRDLHHWVVEPGGSLYNGWANALPLEKHEARVVESPDAWERGTLTCVDDRENEPYLLCPICGSPLAAEL